MDEEKLKSALINKFNKYKAYSEEARQVLADLSELAEIAGLKSAEINAILGAELFADNTENTPT